MTPPPCLKIHMLQQLSNKNSTGNNDEFVKSPLVLLTFSLVSSYVRLREGQMFVSSSLPYLLQMVTWCPAGAASTRWRPVGRNTNSQTVEDTIMLQKRDKERARVWCYDPGRDVTLTCVPGPKDKNKWGSNNTAAAWLIVSCLNIQT